MSSKWYQPIIIKLFNVKTFVTMFLTIIYGIALLGKLEVDENFNNMYQLILVFYFSYKASEKKTE